jgi:hypothetical protein
MYVTPFVATVNASGQAVVEVGHSLSSVVWKVYQIGFALGQAAPSPQVAAHFNGVPLAASATMQTSVFADIVGQAPYAMENFMFGPPYLYLNSGDQITCAVLGANSGDTFTAAVYYDLLDASVAQNMGS